MSRRMFASESGPPPVLALIIRIDAQHRVRLPGDLALIVPWLADEANDEVFVYLGAAGGLRLFPQTAKLIQLRTDFFRGVASAPLSEANTDADGLQLARYHAGSWRLPLAREQSRFSLTLPEGPRKLGLCPSAGEEIVVFGGGELLELWPATEWISSLRRTAGQQFDSYADRFER